MKLESSFRRLSTYQAVRDLEEKIQRTLIDGVLSISDLPAPLKWSEKESQAVFRQLKDLKMGTNIRREVCRNLFEIEKRDGILPSAFLADHKI